MSNEAKIAQLRAKTDRELLILIEHELDRALRLAGVTGRCGSGFHVEAEHAYRKLIVLLLKSAEPCGWRRGRIEAKVKTLRFRLDRAATEKVQEFEPYAA